MLNIGYRWYDAQNTAPLFPFGHGLSYTTFGYSSLNVVGSISASGSSSAVVTALVNNSGAVLGAEVVQVSALLCRGHCRSTVSSAAHTDLTTSSPFC